MPVPSNIKYFKPFLTKKRILSTSCTTPSFGKYGIKVLSSKKIDDFSINSFSKTMTKGFKAVMQCYIFREPIINGNYTKKGNGVRQGGGKGGRCGNYVRLRKGQVIFEIDKSDIKTIATNLKKASSKMPIKVCIVKRRYCF